MPAWYYPDGHEEPVVGNTYILNYRSSISTCDKPYKCVVTRIRKRPAEVEVRLEGTQETQTFRTNRHPSPLFPCTEANLKAYEEHLETYQLLEALYYAGNLRLMLRDRYDGSAPITEPQRKLLKALNQYFAEEPLLKEES